MFKGFLLGLCVAAYLTTPACSQSSVNAAGSGAAASVSEVPVAAVPEDRIAEVIHVDGEDPAASDTNPGSARLPYRTVTSAVKAARDRNAHGVGVKLLIHPGTYRESISMPVWGTETDAPIVIEAASAGAVVISGSDIWTGWRSQPNANVYTHAWPYRWSVAPYPAGWEGNVVLASIVRRREMVFLNSNPLTQVLSASELTDNSFFVSEADGTISLQLPAGTSPADATVEVAMRSPLLRAQGKRNLAIRGLVFRHGNQALPDAAVQIVDSAGVLIEDCEVSWNNWDGLAVLVSSDVTIRRTIAMRNGGSGLGGFQLRRLLMEDSGDAFNNWRGAQGGFTGWAVAGSKFGEIHDGLIRRHDSARNQTRGLWLDFDNVNVTIDSVRLRQNQSDNLFIEANQGPIALRSSRVILSQEGSGVLGSNTSDVTLRGNSISGNARAQIEITGVAERPVSNFETKAQLSVRAERWTLQDNLIGAQTTEQMWLITPQWPAFLTTLKSTTNNWVRPNDDLGFRVGTHKWRFRDWQQATGGDLDSTVTLSPPAP